MGLDFSALDSLRAENVQNDFREPLGGEADKTTPKAEKPATGENRQPEQTINKRAETRLNRRAEDLRKAQDAYNAYGENIRRAASLRADILTGLNRGEDPLALLLKAVECIGRMTGDAVIYEQAQKTAATVYGWGLGNTYPLHIQRRELEDRLKRLETAIDRGNLSPADIQRLQGAIDAHRGKLEDIDREIEAHGEGTDTGRTARA